MKGGGAQKMEVSGLEPSGQTLALSSSDITKPQKPRLPLRGFANWTIISELYLHWKQLSKLLCLLSYIGRKMTPCEQEDQ